MLLIEWIREVSKIVILPCILCSYCVDNSKKEKEKNSDEYSENDIEINTDMNLYMI